MSRGSVFMSALLSLNRKTLLYRLVRGWAVPDFYLNFGSCLPDYSSFALNVQQIGFV